MLAAVTLLGVAASQTSPRRRWCKGSKPRARTRGRGRGRQTGQGRRFRAGTDGDAGVLAAIAVAAVCPELLRGFIDADYTLFQYVEPSPAIADPEAWCEAQAQTPLPDDVATSDIIAVVFPPGVDTEYLFDGFTAVLTKPKTGDALPDGTHLRLSQ